LFYGRAVAEVTAMKGRLLLVLVGGLLGLLPLASGQELPAASVVTLSGPGLTLRKALADIKQQTGIDVQDRRGEDVPLPLDWRLRDVPFWQALDRLAVATGSDVQVGGGQDGVITLVKRVANGPRAPVSSSGPFRLALQRLEASRDFQTGVDQVKAVVEVAWEPRLRPLLLEMLPQGLHVTADGTVHRAVGAASSLQPVDGLTAFSFPVELPALQRKWRAIQRIEGSLTAVVPARWADLTFDSLDRLQRDRWYRPRAVRSFTQDGVTATVTAVQVRPNRWSVQISLRPPRARALGSALDTNQARVLLAVTDVALVNVSDGRRVPFSSYLIERNNAPIEGVILYHFTDKGLVGGDLRQWRLNVRAPAALVVMPIPFVFRDVEGP
jgi:hypothetical protein